jgi:hypothetical protein
MGFSWIGFCSVRDFEAEGKMPTLERVLEVIAHVRQKYAQQILDARHGVKNGTKKRRKR